MQVLSRLITALMILTLGGGAQFCLARCAAADSHVPVAKPTCPHCEKHPSSQPPPANPCQRCQVAGQDRTTPDHPTDTPPAPALVGIVENDLAPLVAAHVSSPTPADSTHGPPRDLLNQFCLLLI